MGLEYLYRTKLSVCTVNVKVKERQGFYRRLQVASKDQRFKIIYSSSNSTERFYQVLSTKPPGLPQQVAFAHLSSCDQSIDIQ